MGVAVSGSSLPLSSTQPVHWPSISKARPVAERGPITTIHSARASHAHRRSIAAHEAARDEVAATPTPLQLGMGVLAFGKV